MKSSCDALNGESLDWGLTFTFSMLFNNFSQADPDFQEMEKKMAEVSHWGATA